MIEILPLQDNHLLNLTAAISAFLPICLASSTMVKRQNIRLNPNEKSTGSKASLICLRMS